MITTDTMLDVLVDAADTLTADFDLVDFLQRIVENAATIGGTNLAGLLLIDRDQRLQLMASTTADVHQLEVFQLQNDEGPCLDCFHTARPVSVPDLSERQHRWPTFVAAARERGMESVHAFPLRLRRQTVGALNVFGTTPLPFSGREIRFIQSLADIATIGIIQERTISAAEDLTSQLQQALDTRVIIEQAKGAVAQGLEISIDTAFLRIRSFARNRNLLLTDVCRAIADRKLDVNYL